MSACEETRKSQRYRFGEIPYGSSDHILLLATAPHAGNPGNFTVFLQLLDRDAYANASIPGTVEHHQVSFYLLRAKEAMVCLLERQVNRG